MSEKLPEALYAYRVYAGGTVLRLLSEHHTAEELWKAVREARESEEGVAWFWCPPTPSNVYAKMGVYAVTIAAIQDNDGEVHQPNLKERRQKQAKAQRGSRTHHVGGRVTIGKQAKKHPGVEKR